MQSPVTLLAASIDTARRGGVTEKASVQQVIVDTTVLPKPIPTVAANEVTNQKYWANLDYGNYADPRNVSQPLRAAF